MGNQQSQSPPIPQNPPTATITSAPNANEQAASGCPIHKKSSSAPVASKSSENQPQNAQTAETECPVKTKKYQNPKVYNVYSQEIDPKNQMPAQANQQLAPGQKVELPTQREQSSIPKGGTDSTWLYPSPQMFWNALTRKNKTEGVSEEDITTVVRIHNNMNESTWRKVLEWEGLHPAPKDVDGTEAKLLRFQGRPDELSPKAMFKTWLGHVPPFDRHDWIVDRGGKEVRYIIDYYHDEANADTDQAPANIRDLSSIRSIKVDVRPALDSMQSFVDRVFVMPYYRYAGKSLFQPLPFFPPSATKIAEQQKLRKLENTFFDIRRSCEHVKQQLHSCKTPQECGNAAIALQHCTAHVVCPKLAQDFDECIKNSPNDAQKLDESYAKLAKCVELFEMDSRKTFENAKKM